MNQENRKQIIVAGILGVVLVLVLVYQFAIAGGGGPPAASGAGGTPAGTAAKPAPARPVVATRLQKVDIDLDQLLKNIEVVTFNYKLERISRSPLTPLVGRIRTSTEVGPGSIPSVNVYDITQKSVTGIIYSEYAPVAVVDKEVVSEGHQYADGVVLTRIEPKRVWFKWGDSEIPVELKEL